MDTILQMLADMIMYDEAELSRKRYIFYHMQKEIHSGALRNAAEATAILNYVNAHPEMSVPNAFAQAKLELIGG